MSPTEPHNQQAFVANVVITAQDKPDHTEGTIVQLENPSMQRVLDTTELCELTLSHLSAEDLLSAQSICQTFYSVVKALPKLQEKLFLRSTSSTKRVIWDFNAHIGLLINENTERYPAVPSWISKASLVTQPLRLNTLILSKLYGHDLGICRTVQNRIVAISWPLDVHFEVSVGEFFRLKDPGIHSSSLFAQYRLVFLTQPPATKVELVLVWPDGRCLSSRRPQRTTLVTITNSMGVTLGDVLNEADRRKADLGSIWFPEDAVVTLDTVESVEAELASIHAGK